MTMNLTLTLKVALNQVQILTFVLSPTDFTVFALIFYFSLKLTSSVMLNQTLILMPS